MISRILSDVHTDLEQSGINSMSRLTTGGTYRQTLHASSSVMSSMSDSFVRLAAANVMWLLWYHWPVGVLYNRKARSRDFYFSWSHRYFFLLEAAINIMFHLKGKSDFCRRLDYKHQK